MGVADDARDAAVDVGERHRDKVMREKHRREEKDHHGGRRDRDTEKDKDDRRREKDESRHRDRDREREREREKDNKHRDRDKEAERDRGRNHDRGKDLEREPERPQNKGRGKDRERELERDKDRDRRDRDKESRRNRDKEKDRVEKVERERDDREREKSRGKRDGGVDADLSKGYDRVQNAQGEVEQASAAELRERIARAIRVYRDKREVKPTMRVTRKLNSHKHEATEATQGSKSFKLPGKSTL